MEIHESIGKLKSLHMLILPKNNLRVIPKEIGLLKNLIFINLTHIIDFPDEIKYLDKENGGH
jgi:Leucine-rich repeat (LRR) protein